MTRKQENYMSMTLATLAVLTANSTIWTGTPPFAAAVAAVQAAVAAIGQAVQGQQVNTEGITDDKEEASDAAIALAVRVARLVQAYALDTDNDTLYRQMLVNTPTLDRMEDTVLPAALRDIHDRALALGTAVRDYGMNAALLTPLQAAIGVYEAEISKPRVAIAGRKTDTASIPAEQKKIRLAFAKTDRLVELYEDTQPGFVSDYRAARIVIDLRGRRDTPIPPPQG